MTRLAFSHFDFQTGFIAELDRKYPSYLSAWSGNALDYANDERAHDTHYGYVYEGPSMFWHNGQYYELVSGQYFCAPGRFIIEGGKGIVMSRESWLGMFSIGGPVEREGRLLYIDGCTDSLLVPPVKMGDPCLNLLYFPPGIDQTAHDHPSDRIGMIMSGRGLCHAWNEGEETHIELVPGRVFCIHAGGKHKFSTPYGEEMRVLAYHPDSDFGPTDEEHPMLNRTIVDGVSARYLDDIRTKR